MEIRATITYWLTRFAGSCLLLLLAWVVVAGSVAAAPTPSPPGRQVVITTAPANDPDVTRWAESLAIEQLQGKLGPLLQANIVGPIELTTLTRQAFNEVCAQNRSAAMLSIVPSLKEGQSTKMVEGKPVPYRSFILGSLGIYLTGCNGDVWLQSTFNNYRAVFRAGVGDVAGMHPADEGDSTRALATRLIDAAFTDFSQQVSENQNALKNGFQYGYFLRDGEKSAFFFLKPGDHAAVVRVAFDFGTAARAGLKNGDTIISVNGRPTAGLSADDLNALVSKSASATYELILQANGGTTRLVRFDAEDAPWYAAHPPSQGP